MTNNIPSVWVGCLGCYNNGLLVGDWFAATDAPQDMDDWTSKVAISKYANGDHDSRWTNLHNAERHEELWVFDHENFYGLIDGECSPSYAQELAEILGRQGENAEAFAGFIKNDRGTYEQDLAKAELDFADSYQGESDSLAEFAQDLADEIDPVPVEYRQTWPYSCIDWEYAWRELEIGGDYWTARSDHGTYYVFRSI